MGGESGETTLEHRSIRVLSSLGYFRLGHPPRLKNRLPVGGVILFRKFGRRWGLFQRRCQPSVVLFPGLLTLPSMTCGQMTFVPFVIRVRRRWLTRFFRLMKLTVWNQCGPFIVLIKVFLVRGTRLMLMRMVTPLPVPSLSRWWHRIFLFRGGERSRLRVTLKALTVFQRVSTLFSLEKL